MATSLSAGMRVEDTKQDRPGRILWFVAWALACLPGLALFAGPTFAIYIIDSYELAFGEHVYFQLDVLLLTWIIMIPANAILSPIASFLHYRSSKRRLDWVEISGLAMLIFGTNIMVGFFGLLLFAWE